MITQPFSTAHVDYLQRTGISLSSLPKRAPSTSAPPDLRRLWRIESVGRFDKSSKAIREPRLSLPSKDVLIGLYGEKIPLAFLLCGTPSDVAVHIGTWSQAREKVSGATLDCRQEILGSLLRGLYPSIELTPVQPELDRPSLCGLVLGIPTAKPPVRLDGALPIDRLIRAMAGGTWGCLVLAEPVGEIATVDLRNSLMSEMRIHNADVQAPLARHYSRLLAIDLKSLASGLEVGLWRTGVYLVGDRESYYRLSSVWRGIFSGDKSLPEPVRVYDSAEAGQLAVNWALPDTPGAPGPGEYRHPLQCQTLLTSAQLAAYVHLPQLETNGFAIRTVPDFDAVPPPMSREKPLRLGSVVLRGRRTETPYAVGLKDLTRHAFVAGVTGAGKTNTIFYLLKQAAAQGVPFLVLEAAKSEYRALLDDSALRERLQVFTLGDELTSPFRLNPFEVVSWPTIPIGVHLDLLRSVFSASFGMWTPLPQILEQCLHEVYKDRGWDIATNTNHRLDDKSAVEDAFPTLSDLAAKADEVIQKLGYESKITDDLRAALLTRINGLRVGGKGSMLDVQRSLPMDALLQLPTVLELQGMGDDDDKAFLMGLLLIRLYEYRRAGNEVSGLQHLIVIEEAHRLLANVGSRKNEEQADPRAKAVETFANLLSEIRAYGQGVIVSDQVPVKLAPEIIKNTNLKIAHRIVAADDRQALAGAMAMTGLQRRALATLTIGQAAVFSAGDDAPVLVQVPQSKDQKDQGPPDDKTVREYMSSSEVRKANQSLFQPGLLGIDASDPKSFRAYESARILAEDASFRRDFLRLVVSITENDGALDRLWGGVVARACARRTGNMEEHVLLRCLIVYSSRWFAYRRGAQEAWSYADTAELDAHLRGVLLAKLENRDASEALESFRRVMYRLHARPFEPFLGCAKICTQAMPLCLYRRAVADLIATSKEDLAGRWNTAIMNDTTNKDGLKQTWNNTQRVSLELIECNAEQADATRRIRLCYAQHMLSRDFAENHQADLEALLVEAESK